MEVLDGLGLDPDVVVLDHPPLACVQDSILKCGISEINPNFLSSKREKKKQNKKEVHHLKR
jgi:hypothetical protein